MFYRSLDDKNKQKVQDINEAGSHYIIYYCTFECCPDGLALLVNEHVLVYEDDVAEGQQDTGSSVAPAP